MDITKLYNDEIELAFNPAKHLYTIDGNPVMGVTGCLSTISKPALIPWAVNMAIAKLEELWTPGLMFDEVQIKDILKEAKMAHRVRKEKAGDIGIMIHEWIEMWIAGENPEEPVNPIIQKAVNAFLKWVEKYKIEFIHSECKVYSKKYNYAGIVDFTAKVEGKLIVGDIKTSSGIYPEMHAQVAAYQNALQEEFPDEKYEATVIVRCSKDGEFEISESDEYDKNLEMFLASLTIYKRLREIKDKTYAKKR